MAGYARGARCTAVCRGAATFSAPPRPAPRIDRGDRTAPRPAGIRHPHLDDGGGAGGHTTACSVLSARHPFALGPWGPRGEGGGGCRHGVLDGAPSSRAPSWSRRRLAARAGLPMTKKRAPACDAIGHEELPLRRGGYHVAIQIACIAPGPPRPARIRGPSQEGDARSAACVPASMHSRTSIAPLLLSSIASAQCAESRSSMVVYHSQPLH